MAELVPEMAARLIGGLRFSKTMRWGAGTGLRFSRPVRWIVAKLDGETVRFELHGLTAGDVSQGHRFLGAPARPSRRPAATRRRCEAVAVIASHEARRATIVAGLDAAAEAAGGVVERPGRQARGGPVPGRVAERDHGALRRAPPAPALPGPRHRDAGPPALLPAPGRRGRPAADVPGRLQRRPGPRRRPSRAATRACSTPACRTPSSASTRTSRPGWRPWTGRLDAIVFHTRLGSMAAKRDRLVAGVGEVAALVGADPATRATAERAAVLAKADQGAVLVAEFSELEGYVAAEYARRAGVPEEVARAVEEHYLPEGASSPLPAGPAGAILAAAERIDNLVGAFAVDEAPTGSKDPYGLRRAALGLLRIALERGWDIDPAPLLESAHARLSAQGADLALGADETTRAHRGLPRGPLRVPAGRGGRRRRGGHRRDRRGGGRAHHHRRVGARHPGRARRRRPSPPCGPPAPGSTAWPARAPRRARRWRRATTRARPRCARRSRRPRRRSPTAQERGDFAAALEAAGAARRGGQPLLRGRAGQRRGPGGAGPALRAGA